MESQVLSALIELLDLCVAKGGSDLHISANMPAAFRQNGEIKYLNDQLLDSKASRQMVLALMNEQQKKQFLQNHMLDFGYSSPTGHRFRIHAYQERGSAALAARHLGDQLKTPRQLGLPVQVDALASLNNGLVLVCGATGSGKTTTLNALLNMINQNQARHILTIEDPIELIHQNKKSIVHQRELHSDVADFASAVRASLREDPDVIMVGEMRDLETMRAALTAAETGHLVLSTLHTNDAVGVVERLIGSFPGDEQEVARQRIGKSLKAVIAQQLVVTEGGLGRTIVAEILMVNQAVSNLIGAGKTNQIHAVMESGTREGMQTLDQALSALIRNKTISHKRAKKLCDDPEVLDRLLTGVSYA